MLCGAERSGEESTRARVDGNVKGSILIIYDSLFLGVSHDSRTSKVKKGITHCSS